MSRSRPARVSSSRAIASASRRMSSRSRVTSPMIRMPSPGPGNGWRQTISDGQAELLADQPHLVLEQGAQRLDQLELQVVGQAADVVVGLDVGGAGAAAGLDDVGVERALHQEGDLVAVAAAHGVGQHLGLRGLEDPDELAADDLALLLRVGDTDEGVEELLLRVDHLQVDAGGGHEVALDLLGLALAHQPVVDVDAGEPVADRPLHQRRGHRGVDAAGQAADRLPPVADLVADRLDLLLDDVDHRPGGPAAGDLVQEVLEHLLAVLGVHHLGVPLHAGHPPSSVLEGRDRGHVGAGEHPEALRGGGHRVAVGHPHGVLGRDARRAGCRRRTRSRRSGRTRARRCGRPRRRAPAPSAGSRSTCRRRVRRPSKSAGSRPGAPSA